MAGEPLPIAAASSLDVLSSVTSARADVVALATVASLARRIEPELLRALRLGLADRFPADARPHAGTESALWFSPLVESRGPDSITLLPEISRQLQDSLAADSDLLEAARRIIEECHRVLPAVLRWEEDLVYVALTRSLTEIARQRRIKDAAHQAFDAISQNDRQGLEERVREMWSRLPAPATTNSYLANVHHLCDIRALRRRGARSEAATGSFQTIPLYVRRADGMWQLGVLDDGAELIIRVPAIEPVTLDVLKSQRSRRVVRTLLIRGDHRVEVPIGNRPLVLRTIDGQIYSLASEGLDRAPEAAEQPSDGTTILNEARVIVVGSAGVGKTSLVQRLLEDQWSPQTPTTHGIRITEWRVSLPNAEQVDIHIWDSGGQQIHSGVHERFFGRRAVFLVVLSGRSDPEAEADLWLNRVSAYAEDAPVVVATNKIGERRSAFDSTPLRSQYPNIKSFVETDAVLELGIDALRRALIDAVAALPHLRLEMPRSWAAAYKRLSQTPEPYLELAAFRQICAAEGVSSPDQLARVLHDAGIILYIDAPRLRDTVVLRLDWLVGAIDRIIEVATRQTVPWEIHQSGLSRAPELGEYPRSLHDYLLGVMERFELCLRYPGPEDRYLIPQLLDAREPEAAAAFAMSECLNFQYTYSAWFDSLIARFIVRTHEMSERQPRWRYGVILESGANRALVRADSRRKVVTISVEGAPETRRALLALIRSQLDAIHEAIPNLQISAEVPLPGNRGALSYEMLQRRLDAGRLTVVDPTTGEDFDIRTLLGDVPVKREDFSRARVFIGYAHEDRASLETLKISLSPFEDEIEIWDDSRIEAGQEWEQEIRMSIERADVIVFLMSERFLASSFAADVYLKLALERHKSREADVVPVILRPCVWEETPLRNLQVLPRGARPISRHPNAKSAWAEVARDLIAIIDNRRDERARREGGRGPRPSRKR